MNDTHLTLTFAEYLRVKQALLREAADARAEALRGARYGNLSMQAHYEEEVERCYSLVEKLTGQAHA